MSVDLNDLVTKQLKRQRPQNKDGSGTFDVSRSTVDMLSKVRYVLKTGIEPFDIACGGLAFGRVVEMYGLESCGKTAMCIRSLIKAQCGEIYERKTVDGTIQLEKLDTDSIGVTTVFIDNEQSVDEGDKIMVDGAKLDCVLLRCDTVDQIFKITEIVIKKISDQQAAEDKKAKEEKRKPVTYFVVLVVDTVAGTSDKKEMTKDWNKDDYPRQAKMLSEGFRRMQRQINRHNVLMICTNQVRGTFNQEAPGARKIRYSTPQDDDYATFGGKALKFYASQRFFMFCLNKNYKLTGSKFTQGLLIGVRTPKNRIVKPLRESRMVLLFDGGFNNLFSKLETMLFLGLAKYSPSTKRISFKFGEAGIKPSTFTEDAPKKSRRRSAGQSLEDDDDAGTPTFDNPEIEAKRDWPAMYEAHKVDFDALWGAAERSMFEDVSFADDTSEDDGSDIDFDEDD